ncbi:MAG: hypothetical protein K2N07_07510, partial [Desulfovibrio sp.]|nr:hypothetical protein [Desulfovibrio sp.]
SLLLFATSSFTGLKEGEQPIETLHLERLSPFPHMVGGQQRKDAPGKGMGVLETSKGKAHGGEAKGEHGQQLALPATVRLRPGRRGSLAFRRGPACAKGRERRFQVRADLPEVRFRLKQEQEGISPRLDAGDAGLPFQELENLRLGLRVGESLVADAGALARDVGKIRGHGFLLYEIEIEFCFY